jgi:hypothetical protein
MRASPCTCDRLPPHVGSKFATERLVVCIRVWHLRDSYTHADHVQLVSRLNIHLSFGTINYETNLFLLLCCQSPCE